MKLLFTLGASLTLSVAAQSDNESVKPAPASQSDRTQLLPRAKEEIPGKTVPALDRTSKIEASLAKRRARITEARSHDTRTSIITDEPAPTGVFIRSTATTRRVQNTPKMLPNTPRRDFSIF